MRRRLTAIASLLTNPQGREYLRRLLHSTSNVSTDSVREVDVSELSKDFADNVRRATLTRFAEVKEGKFRWNENTQISDTLAKQLAEGFATTIDKSKSPQKSAFNKAAQEFKEHKFPILLIKGIPTNQVSLPSETQNIFYHPELLTAGGIFTGFLLGTLGLRFTYDQEHLRIRLISPKYFAADGNFDSASHLGWHVDSYTQTTVSQIPEYTCLYCIQNNEKVPTRFLTAQQIFTAVDDKYKETLLGKNFCCVSREGFYNTKIFGDNFPIFRKNYDGSIGIQYSNFGNIEGTTPEAKEALQHLHQKVSQLDMQNYVLNLIGGNLLVFRNSPLKSNVIHSRDAIKNPLEACENPLRRLLLRVDANQANAANNPTEAESKGRGM